MSTAKQLIDHICEGPRVLNDPDEGPPVPDSFVREIMRVLKQVKSTKDPFVSFDYAGTGRKKKRPIAYIRYDMMGGTESVKSAVGMFAKKGYDVGLEKRPDELFVQR